MVDAGPRVAAELAYQRALTALHEARQDVADIAAARRRLAFDRPRLDDAQAQAKEQELRARSADASGRVEVLRETASRLREELRRLSDDGTAEPTDLPPSPPGEGFEQPPFEQPPFRQEP